MITLKQLEIFSAVTRHGSFRKCAEELGVSQVSISEHIRSLEDRLGRPLFDRHPGGPATLTPAGRQAQIRVASILAEIGDFIDEIGGARHGGKRTITVAMHAFLMRNLHDTLRDFANQHAGIEVKLDLEDQSIETLLSKVADRHLDLAYFYAFNEADAPGTVFLRQEELAIFVGSDFPLGSSGVVSATELQKFPAIFLAPRNPLRGLIDRALESIGASGGPIDVQSDDYGLLLHSVRRNQGFACMFRASEEELLLSSGLRTVELETPLPPLQVRLSARRSGAHDTVLRKLKTIIGDADTSGTDLPTV